MCVYNCIIHVCTYIYTYAIHSHIHAHYMSLQFLASSIFRYLFPHHLEGETEVPGCRLQLPGTSAVSPSLRPPLPPAQTPLLLLPHSDQGERWLPSE